MTENEEDYLRQCLEKGICPTCQQPIVKKQGSGQFKDGVFCSLGCHGKWHEVEFMRRHQERMRKGRSDE